MAKFEREVLINASPERVFETITDFRRLPEWFRAPAFSPPLVSVETQGAHGAGLRLETRYGGGKFMVDEFDRWEEPRRLCSRVVDENFGLRRAVREATQEIEVLPEGPNETRVRWRMAYTLGGWRGWLALPFLAGTPLAMLRGSLNALKVYIERRPAVAPEPHPA